MSSGALGGSIPQQNWGPEQPGYKRLYYSIREIALLLDKTIQAGYGVLRAGTILAENVSAAGNKGKLVPYAMTAFDQLDVGRAFAVANVGDGATTINVLMDDSYKFTVGDDLIIAQSDGPAYHDGGAIVTIDRTTYPHYAVITFTTLTTSTGKWTVANGVGCYVAAGASGKLSTAKYILDKDVDTGKGSNAKGAITPVLVSNAILYTNSLVYFDAAAATALGTVDDGQFTILK